MFYSWPEAFYNQVVSKRAFFSVGGREREERERGGRERERGGRSNQPQIIKRGERDQAVMMRAAKGEKRRSEFT